MHKMIVLYKAPPRPEQFRDHYENVHLPLVGKMPGLIRMNHSFDVRDPAGNTAFFCVFEACFASRQAMADANASPQGAAVLADLQNFETGPMDIIDFAVPDAE